MIRDLRPSDLEYMLEWMRDKDVTKNLQADFASFTKQMARDFIEKSKNKENVDNVHFAICDDNDEYMGTISLKNISKKDRNAEYAIVTRTKAHGKGYARIATDEILKYGFDILGLEKIYLYVSVNNIAANKFYKKCGFIEEGVFRKHLNIKGKLENIRWYSILKEEFQNKEP